MKPFITFKNLGIFLLAPLLALGIFFVTRDLSGLTASVLDVGELNRIVENQRGVAYKTEGNVFELFGSELAKKGERLTFEVLYHPQKVIPHLEQSSGSNYHILEQASGSIQVEITSLSGCSEQEGWFQFPFSGESKQLVLAEAFLHTSTGTSAMSVGNLNTNNEHTVLP